jgi:putative oxidoreductase
MKLILFQNSLPNPDPEESYVMSQAKVLNIFDWLVRIVVAVILLQTLFFKFSGAKESIYIFSTLGVEPWGRLGSGAIELIAALLLLVPRTAVLGAILALGTISGAIFAHLTKLGIKLTAVNDHGELFALAVAVFVGSLVIVYLHRAELPVVGPKLFAQLN